MAANNYSGTKTEKDDKDRLRAVEGGTSIWFRKESLRSPADLQSERI